MYHILLDTIIKLSNGSNLERGQPDQRRVHDGQDHPQGNCVISERTNVTESSVCVCVGVWACLWVCGGGCVMDVLVVLGGA